MQKIVSIVMVLLTLNITLIFGQLKVSPDTTYNTNAAWRNIRKNYPDSKIANIKMYNNIKSEYNIVYATINNIHYGNRDLHLDIFSPPKKGMYPALFLIHGGAWRSGNKTMEYTMAKYIAAHGFVTIPVEYRLYPEASFPVPVHDIKAAIRWIKANADKYSVDTTRLAIEGNSAGGQLATLVAMTNDVSEFEGSVGTMSNKAHIHAVIDIDGVVNFLSPSSLNLNRGSDSPDVLWLGGSYTEKPKNWRDASACYWVDNKSVPVLFITSSQPKYTAGMFDMIDLLKQNNVYTERHTLGDSPHTFWLFSPWFEPTVKYMVNFLNKVFKN